MMMMVYAARHRAPRREFAALVPLAVFFAALSLARAQDRGPDSADEKARPTDGADLVARAFSPERTRARRVALLRAVGDGAVVVVKQRAAGGGEELEDFRGSRDLLYLTGQKDPELCLVLTSRGEHVLFAPPRDEGAEKWRGARLSPGAESARALGVDAVEPNPGLRAFLRSRLEGARALFVSGLSAESARELGRAAGVEKVEPAAPHVGRLRQVKDEDELALLRRAIDASCAGHVEAMRSTAPGRFEYEIQAAAEYVFRRFGAERQGYSSIVGSGPNSCVLHYSANRRRARAGDVICADMGAELGGYTADVTRTFPAGGRFTEEQRKIYETVLRAQEAAIREVRPGSTVKRVHEAAKRVIAEAGYGAYFPHGTSHWLGLDVHDAGDYALPLAPGMVLTVEPGIYIPEKELGVRIEDDVLVTNDGAFVLSSGAPKSVEAVEALVREGKGVGDRPVAPLPRTEPLPSLRRGKVY